MLMGLTIVVGVGSFLVYSELHHSHEEGFWHELWLEVFAGLSLESLATLLIALLPLKILDGRRIFSWSRLAWIAIYFVALMAFVLVVTPVAHDHGFLRGAALGMDDRVRRLQRDRGHRVGPVPGIPGPRSRRRRVRGGYAIHPRKRRSAAVAAAAMITRMNGTRSANRPAASSTAGTRASSTIVPCWPIV